MPAGRVRVDTLDFRILRELFAGETEAWRSDRVPIDGLARTLRVHRNTVSQRVAKLRRYRAFLPLTLEIEPSAFGIVGGLASLDVPQAARTEAMRDELFQTDGVQTILRFSDGWIVILFARSIRSLETTAEKLRVATGASSVRWEVHSARDYPPAARHPLSPLEYRILTALFQDSRRSFHEVGRRLGVTASTVQRRFDRLARAGLVYMYPGGDIDVAGMAMAYLHVRIDEKAEPRDYPLSELFRVLPNHFIRNAATRGHAHFFLYGESLADLEGQLEAVRRIPFVEIESFRPFLGRWMNPRYSLWLSRVLSSSARSEAENIGPGSNDREGGIGREPKDSRIQRSDRPIH